MSRIVSRVAIVSFDQRLDQNLCQTLYCQTADMQIISSISKSPIPTLCLYLCLVLCNQINSFILQIKEMLPEMDLACRKPLETMCHTINLNKPFKSINKIFVAAILDFCFLYTSCKIFAKFSTQVVIVGICRDDFHRPTFCSTPCPSNPPGSLGMLQWAAICAKLLDAQTRNQLYTSYTQ